MAIPKTLNPVGNTIPFSVVSANHLDQVGRAAELRLTLGPNGFAIGTNLKLDFLGQTWQYNFVDSPDDSGLELTGKATLMAFADWWPIFISQMKFNRYIFPFYSISESNSNTIVFSAREIGEIYTIVLGEANTAITLNVRVPGLDEIAKINFGIHAQLILSLGQSEQIIGEDRIAGNEVKFDFHNYLATTVAAEMYFPQIVTEWKKVNSNAIRSFFIRYWERAGNYFGAIQDSAIFKAVTGGVPKVHEKLISEDAITYEELLKSADILIQTNRPLRSKITYDQPIQFYFLNTFTLEKIFTADLLLKYTDASTAAPILNGGNSITLQADEQGCFILSPAIHDLKGINASKTIQFIEFKITCETLTSETFVLELENPLFSRNIIYKNSFGVWDSATFRGISELDDKYTRLFFEALTTKIQTKVSENETLVLNSGWLYKEERNWLRELIGAPETYYVAANNLFRININNNEFKRHIDKLYQYSLRIEIELTGDNQFYSNKTATGLAAGTVIADDNFIIGDDNIVIGF
ncbi:MAG: hypothetical protein JXR34_12295 [Bacteroidales bacterium]|nr:hypothetical protein [Bacteroidales bacterium]